MRIEAAHFSASFYLYKYDTDFSSNLVITDKPKAIKFKNLSRLIDNECNLIDSGGFSKSLHTINLNALQINGKIMGCILVSSIWT